MVREHLFTILSLFKIENLTINRFVKNKLARKSRINLVASALPKQWPLCLVEMLPLQ